MRIMIDTNILISAILFPNSHMDGILRIITEKHKLVLSSFVVNEFFEVVKRKFANKVKLADRFLVSLPFELVYTPKNIEEGMFEIRDSKDYPVLYMAIVEDVDILITGDKDFFDVEIERPEILTPTQFLERYS
ncbi:putative toxin-antitoxin system toxin component, PIN family [Alkalihalobacillus oceani]|uniref:putative toxin-antitoxin system toxin component, PIN family n=1 Tax=Halalkalibacter oceani TaxID=1653776 RepID=UPI00203EBCB8|nr:putative toxin-antitoxin system toxin component, PIN family [Halalkalibacter oceani]MCM3760156.1 putative toxin-antitoxin system toxin component, PIN family [Halalkalibacter oceani]